MTDHDPRLVDLYDTDNPSGPDHDFYRALAEQISATSILDLGCGTGLLTVTLGGDDRSVVGVDPSATMLATARRRPGADAVSWVLGDSRSLPAGPFDYAVMTGNVAQHVPDAEWDRTLRDLRRAMTDGGTLAFESRNPAARAWEEWASAAPCARQTPHGDLVEWMDVVETGPGTIELIAHNRFVDSGETLTETQSLVFRDPELLRQQLDAAGFDVHAVYGDWRRGLFTGAAPIIVVVARAR